MLSHHIHLNGQPFHYLGWGDRAAPVILMLHGFPEYSGAWSEIAEDLGRDYHCVAPDQRGYGQSWTPEEVSAYRTGKLVGDMVALIEHLGGGPVIVFGHDWGAAVAYGLAIARPDLVSRLIIANGVHPGPFQRALAAGGAQTAASQYIHYLRAEGSEARLEEDDFSKLFKMFGASMDMSWMTPERRAAYLEEWRRPGRMRGMVNWYRASPMQLGGPGETIADLPEMPAEALRVRMPHLLIWGARDGALLPEATEGLEDYCDDLTRITIETADHWILHQESHRVAAEVRAWLQRR
ncbi:alpha/beta fold hydrolase [Thalassovita mangrovi]|uniref:Alpha/beta fold hydrolase n=1 Tax=Thalassovita mangrovi TaxID=2692236 RepID=A0A6L8LKW6_9RHOB|nr:alpha/beta hydrolase [Thalassovita mangrovi]MYM56515.1 alpha/beta fold hydrolase [Thalassovita mangrovi]